MTDKEKQRELIIEIMKADEQSGLYDEPTRKQTGVDWLIEQVKSRDWENKFIWHKEEDFQRAMYKHNEQIMDVIEFMRRNNKMDKSVEDLYQQYTDEFYSV